MTDNEIDDLANEAGLDLAWRPELNVFARAIRKKTMEDILASLKGVPNPDANRSAINRIEWMMNYD